MYIELFTFCCILNFIDVVRCQVLVLYRHLGRVVGYLIV